MASSLVRSISRSLRTVTAARLMSNVPENTVYGGPKPQNPNQRVTLTQLRQKHKKREAITVVTAYDYPSAVHVDTAGIDVCLVGGSASMVVHGHDTTLPISLDEMLLSLPRRCSWCRKAASCRRFALWFIRAVDSAVRVLKEGGMDAIKLEGGSPSRITAARSVVEAGIAVMGHVGLTPQAISVLGGFRPQGRNIASAVKVVETAMALQEAGCFSVVLECVPPPVAAAATSALHIPTIGIGAGPFCSGQVQFLHFFEVLVYHDLLGMMQHPHHAKVTPKFCKQYAQVGEVINKALLEYKEEVSKHSFPGPSHSPYKISSNDLDGFLSELQKLGLDEAASAAAASAEKMESSASLSSQ
ncbi:hypothetical protein F2Q69_00062378 [Brassica cretica]|uniref:3-methyl-2-oxobutanoate hydroxymethyltransferase n=1 Tax=Brassica cretica TaxID=69181 RepID=A0A8S9RL07_BRACR|nr:hypothetical protein F2Q69_00062378 [Brassica cretica]